MPNIRDIWWYCFHYQILPRLSLMEFPTLVIGSVYFCFKGCWVVFFSFIQSLKETSVSKPWRPIPDAAFCFAYVPQKDARLIWVKSIGPSHFHQIDISISILELLHGVFIFVSIPTENYVSKQRRSLSDAAFCSV